MTQDERAELTRLRAELECLKKQNDAMERAMRPILAVADDDPILIEPSDKEIFRLRAELERLTKELVVAMERADRWYSDCQIIKNKFEAWKEHDAEAHELDIEATAVSAELSKVAERKRIAEAVRLANDNRSAFLMHELRALANAIERGEFAQKGEGQ